MTAETSSGRKSVLIILIYFILVSGEILNVLGAKEIQYPLFAALALIFFIRHTKITYNSLHVLYLLFFLVSFLIHIVSYSLELKTILLASVYYLFIPAIFGSNNITAKTVLKSFHVCSYISFIGIVGLILEKNNLLPGFYSETTLIGNEVQNRAASFFGSSLLFGFMSAFNTLINWFCIIEKVGSKKINIIIIIISIISLLLSYSRGAYLITLIGGFFIYLKFYSKTRKFKIVFVSIFVIFISFFILDFSNNVLFTRLTSFLDFQKDEGNVERYVRWAKSFNIFFNNFWIGIGPGSTGGVGVSKEDAWDYSHEYGIVTESYALKIFVENGIVIGLFFLVFLFKSIFTSLRTNFPPEGKIAVAMFLGLTIETFTLQSLESPFMSFIFWLLFAILAYPKRQFDFRDAKVPVS